MISKAIDVQTYIAEVPAERQAVMKKLRALSKQIFKGCEESIDYGMPCYMRDGVMQFAFASQKQYIALYAGKKAIDQFRGKLSGASLGKGCIRFTSPEKIDFAVIEPLLRVTAKARSAPR